MNNNSPGSAYSFRLLVCAMSAFGALSILSACNGQSQGLSSQAPPGYVISPGTDGGGDPTSTGPGTPGGPSTIGESCEGSGKTCLAMHFVSYKSSAGTAVASATQAAKIIHTANQLWSQCDIAFQIENYEAVDPTQYSLAYGAQSQNQLNEIRQTFTTTNDQLLAVTTGPWGTAVNAWTNLPGEGLYGAIMEASIVDYGSGIIYAHEFGHYLGLDHVSDTSNLMNPVIYTTSTSLSSSQCQEARSIASQYWSAMLRS